MTATRLPPLAACIAAPSPPGPVPMTITSNFESSMGSISGEFFEKISRYLAGHDKKLGDKHFLSRNLLSGLKVRLGSSYTLLVTLFCFDSIGQVAWPLQPRLLHPRCSVRPASAESAPSRQYRECDGAMQHANRLNVVSQVFQRQELLA